MYAMILNSKMFRHSTFLVCQLIGFFTQYHEISIEFGQKSLKTYPCKYWVIHRNRPIDYSHIKTNKLATYFITFIFL
jgi:hypothetical protein